MRESAFDPRCRRVMRESRDPKLRVAPNQPE